MTINNEKISMDEFADKVMAALRVGLREMTEKAAANNEILIVGDDNGGFKSVPAKELLKELDKAQ